MKIVFFDIRENEEQFFKNKFKNYELFFYPDRLDNQTVIDEVMSQAEVISCFTFSRVEESVLRKFPKLKLIALRSVGFNHIDIDYCKEHNIAVVNSRGYGDVTVAEYTFALIFDVIRKSSRAYLNLKNEHLDKDEYTGFELLNSTIGIIGTGAIGTQVARIANGIGMNILAYDIYKNDEICKKYNVKYTEFEDLIRNSDIITLHSPLTESNFHIIDRDKFKIMKRNSIIINTARGELIDSQALYEALAENRIFGAGLDVLESENILTQPEKKWNFDYFDSETVRQTLLNERLLKLHNVVITPHIAFNTVQAQDRIMRITYDNIEKFMLGQIQNNVN